MAIGHYRNTWDQLPFSSQVMRRGVIVIIPSRLEMKEISSVRINRYREKSHFVAAEILAKRLFHLLRDEIDSRGDLRVKLYVIWLKKLKKLDAHVIPRSGRLCVPVEVVVEVYNTITSSPLDTARSVAGNLEVPKTTVLKLLRSVLRMFPSRFQCAQMDLETEQQRVDFEKFFLIRDDEVSR
ncbi:hypothetical protein AVEN_246542-1 [Araneus ventricosus]|uniref:Uncharacterized protein n=1 Tax=Araneus ventricosus TaxID=182803 RepID=A0A4Y2TB33_ARAVE|nr:hypothetical protein AVEN_246542-1 [Araneus ventricosus]